MLSGLFKEEVAQFAVDSQVERIWRSIMTTVQGRSEDSSASAATQLLLVGSGPPTLLTLLPTTLDPEPTMWPASWVER